MNYPGFLIGRRQGWILLSLKDGDADTRTGLRDLWFAGRLENAEQKKNARSKVTEALKGLWRRGWVNLEDQGRPQKIKLTRSGEIVTEKLRKLLREERCTIGQTYVCEDYEGPLNDQLDDETEGLLWELPEYEAMENAR